MHALAAMLQNNPSITELNVRMNSVTDEGARALAAVLAGNSRLRTVDLRENHVGKSGVRAIAEALERSQRVRHVYVHAGGKIEALGTGMWAAPRGGQGGQPEGGAAPGGGMMTVETVCAVDVRDNTEAPRTDEMGGGTFGLTDGGGGGAGGTRRTQRSPLRPETDEAGGGGGMGATNATRASRAPASTKRRTKSSKASRKPKTSKEEAAERKARREYKRMVRRAACDCATRNAHPHYALGAPAFVTGARPAAATRGRVAGPCWWHGRSWPGCQNNASLQPWRPHWRVAGAASGRHRRPAAQLQPWYASHCFCAAYGA